MIDSVDTCLRRAYFFTCLAVRTAPRVCRSRVTVERRVAKQTPAWIEPRPCSSLRSRISQSQCIPSRQGCPPFRRNDLRYIKSIIPPPVRHGVLRSHIVNSVTTILGGVGLHVGLHVASHPWIPPIQPACWPACGVAPVDSAHTTARYNNSYIVVNILLHQHRVKTCQDVKSYWPKCLCGSTRSRTSCLTSFISGNRGGAWNKPQAQASWGQAGDRGIRYVWYPATWSRRPTPCRGGKI